MPKKMYVVFCENDGTYWCGLNTWDKQLRKAKVFHSLKYANEVAERFKQLKLKNLEIRMDLVPENPTNADRIRAMSDEELLEALHSQIGCGRDFIPCGKVCGGKCECFTDEACRTKVLAWLQQPAGER